MSRFAMKAMARALEDVSSSLQPRPQYGHFIHPDNKVAYKALPHSTDTANYLQIVSNNILVEYKHFLEQTFLQQILVTSRMKMKGFESPRY
jgi:hypothetical protein